jgi:hypothetical protein
LDFGEAIQIILALDGEYKITDGRHMDIEYMYVADLDYNRLSCYRGHYNDRGNFIIEKDINLAEIKTAIGGR